MDLKIHFIYVLIIDLEKEKEVVRKNKREKFIVGYIPTTKKIVLGVNELHFIEGIPLSFFFFFNFISNLARKSISGHGYWSLVNINNSF